jgi:hypothetical protein
MKNHRQQSEEDLDKQVTQTLAQDLRRLYQSPDSIPESVDRAILAQVAIRRRRPSTMRIYRNMVAAAALIGIAVGLWVFRQANLGMRPDDQPSTSTVARTDIDQNGTVNILDAYSLARRIKTEQPTRPAWDLNTDGQINQADVDLVAYAAVRINEKELL